MSGLLKRNALTRKANQSKDNESDAELEARANALATSAKLLPASSGEHYSPTVQSSNTYALITSHEELQQLVPSTFPNSRKLKSGKIVQSVIVQIHASLCEIWSFNNRLNELDVDVSDIAPSIIAAGTNSTPATGVIKYDENKNITTISIVAGSRRYKVCAENQLLLTVEIFSVVSNSDAYYLMQIENMRSDPDVFSFCYGLARAMLPLDDGSVLYKDQEALGKEHGFVRERVNKLLSVAKIPKCITNSIENRKKVSRAKAIKLGIAYNGLTETSKLRIQHICSKYLAQEKKIPIADLLDIVNSEREPENPNGKGIKEEGIFKLRAKVKKFEDFENIEVRTDTGISTAIVLPAGLTQEAVQSLVNKLKKEIDLSLDHL